MMQVCGRNDANRSGAIMARTDELKAILDDLPGSTTSAKLKALIPSIDAKVRAGARHEEIIEALKQQGFNLTLANFRSILYRYRKRIRESPEKQMEEKQNGNSAPVERTQPKPDGNSSTRNLQALQIRS